MTDSPTSRYKVRKQSLGSNVNTHGDPKLNENLDIFDRGSKGYEALAITGDTTLSWTNYGTTNSGQVAILKLTGSLSSAANLVVPSVEWVWDLVWNTTGQTITMKTSAGTGVAIPNGRKVKVFCDASDCYFAVPNYIGDDITESNSRDLMDKAAVETAIATSTIPAAAGTVLVSATDTTAGYLAAKVSASGAAVESLTGAASNEGVNIAVPYTGLIRASTQTTLFTASDNTHYPVDLSSAIAVTLGTSSVGAVIEFTPFGTGAMTVTPSNTFINGSSAVQSYSESAGTLRAVYVSSARGWNMPIQTSGGVNFSEPWKLIPMQCPVAGLNIADRSGNTSDCSSTAFWTDFATIGAIETNNLTADTWITIATISGKGLLAGVIGPTSAGADTTTFGIDVDGAGEVEYPVVCAATTRAALFCGSMLDTSFTTSPDWADQGGEFNAGKTVLVAGSAARYIPSWHSIAMLGTPVLEFKRSLVVRVKHSQNISNSTATAFKGAMYRLGLA